MLPIYIVFSGFGLAGKGTAAACATATLIIAVRMNLDRARQVRFWAVIAVAAIINGLLIAYVPIPNENYTFAIVAPIGYVDYLLISACIRLLRRKLSPG